MLPTLSKPPKLVPPAWPGGVPQRVRIAIVGEAPGENEVYEGQPFVGESGKLLKEILGEVGIDWTKCLLTNVVSERPPNNVIEAFGVTRDELPAGYPMIGPMSFAGKNLYLHPSRLWELERLHEELQIADPNIIIALGNTAAWALLGLPAITKMRGTVHRGNPLAPGKKVIATFHPAAIMRQWNMRPIVGADLAKARAEAQFPDIRYSNAEIWIEPELADLFTFEQRYMKGFPSLSVDVETRLNEVVSISVSPRADLSLVIPFRLLDEQGKLPIGNYWPSAGIERTAWKWVKRIMEDRRYPKVGQNFLYDIQRMLTPYGIKVRNAIHDTMLAHHAMWSEMPKDLGFLGSMYTNHPMWKDLAGRHMDELKRDA